MSTIKSAVQMFSQIQQANKTIYTYNTMIKAHLSNSNTNPHIALEIYVKMKRNGINCDNYTYPYVLKACKMIRGLWEGRQVHGEVVKVGFFDSDVFVINGLIGLYYKCEQMSCSRFLFDGFHGKDLVSWNLMLKGYAECRDIVKAQKLFDEMPQRDVISWSIMIDGYGKKLGLVTHARVVEMRKAVAVKGVVESGKSVIEVVGGGVEEFVSGRKGQVRGDDIEEVLWSLSKMVDLE
ncbi:hypothetical protein L1887_34965 [Cichorium endivia]|nr:hypothetical protein L1887_34965 [Cichorium endivia]